MTRRDGRNGTATHLTIQVEQIKRKQTDTDCDVLDLDVLPLPSAQFLEWKELSRVLVDGHCLGIEHECLSPFFDALCMGSILSVMAAPRTKGTPRSDPKMKDNVLGAAAPSGPGTSCSCPLNCG